MKFSSSQKVQAGQARLGYKKIQNPSQARLGLESKLDIGAELGLGTEISWVSELGSARAWT